MTAGAAAGGTPADLTPAGLTPAGLTQPGTAGDSPGTDGGTPRWRSPQALRGVAARLGFGVAGALFLGALKIHRPPELSTVCVLRAVTGVPCPLCGGTTVFVRLGQGRVVDAVLTNPVVLLVAAGLVLAPTGVFTPLRRRPRVGSAVQFGLLGVAWVWQLGRYGFLS